MHRISKRGPPKPPRNSKKIVFLLMLNLISVLIMKKVFFSLFAAWSILIGSAAVAEAARVTDNFSVRFRENTLVVTSTKLQEARLFDEDGRLMSIKQGNICEFELEEKGTYRLLAKVDNKTELRKIVLR